MRKTNRTKPKSVPAPAAEPAPPFLLTPDEITTLLDIGVRVKRRFGGEYTPSVVICGSPGRDNPLYLSVTTYTQSGGFVVEGNQTFSSSGVKRRGTILSAKPEPAGGAA